MKLSTLSEEPPLPNGWSVCSVDEMFRCFGGATPDRGNPEYWRGEVPWLSSGDIKSENITFSSEHICEGALDRRLRLCRRGSVVVVVRSGILKHTLPVGVLQISAAINQDLKCFDSNHDQLNLWLALALRANAIHILKLNREGTTVQSVKTETLTTFRLLLPPLAEQARILAKVEALLARVNAARQRLAKVPALLKRFRQSVLAAACAGQLTEAWRLTHQASESASTLIDRIAASRPAGARGFISDLPHAGELPDGWARTTIAYLAEPTLNGRPYVTSGSRGWARYVSDRGPYFIRSENINTDALRIEEAVRVAAPAGAEADRTRVSAADLLLTITGNNVGRTAVVPQGLPAAHVSQHVAIIRTTRLSDVRYLWLWLRSSNHGQGQLEEHFYGETKPGLNLDQVKSVWVDLPPLDEQREIVRKVEALFALADGVETHVRAATVRAERLTQSILAKAFRGELVPTEAELARLEGREYEPASVLLEWIRAQREAEPTTGGRRGRRSKPVDEAVQDDDAGLVAAVVGADAEEEPARARRGGRQRTLFADDEQDQEQDADDRVDLWDHCAVMAIIRDLFTSGGGGGGGHARSREELIREVARAAGYQRAGKRIAERIDNLVRTAVRRGILDNGQDGLRLLCRSIEEYEPDFLVKQLTAGIGTTWWERDDLIDGTTRWLGFRKTGPVIREKLKAAIALAIRRGLLEAEGSRVRRV